MLGHHGGHHGHHRGRHGHDSHNHVSGVGLGIGLGLLTVAALSSAGSRNSYPSYTPPPTYVYVDTPEQIAERERQRKEAEARRAQAERERLEELERQRLAMIDRENKEEEVRRNIFGQHVQTIRNALMTYGDIFYQQIMALPRLIPPIRRYDVHPYNSIPEADDHSLFSAILFRNDINEYAKNQLLNHLIDQKGYSKWSIKLFNEPLYSNMLSNGPCFELLRKLYLENFINKNILSPVIEKGFQQHCLRQPTENPFILYSAIRGRDHQFQLIVDWINNQNTATAVMDIYDRIRQRDFNLNQVYLRRFLKVAKQKILRMEIQDRSTQHPGENSDRIREFLDIHRGTWTSCISCFFSRASTNIHRMIQSGDIDRANAAWSREDRDIRDDFYRRHQLK